MMPATVTDFRGHRRTLHYLPGITSLVPLAVDVMKNPGLFRVDIIVLICCRVLLTALTMEFSSTVSCSSCDVSGAEFTLRVLRLRQFGAGS